MREDNEGGGQNFISTYPGATPVLSQTKAYIPETWPEVTVCRGVFKVHDC